MDACPAGLGVRCWKAPIPAGLRQSRHKGSKRSMFAGLGVSVVLHGSLLAMAMVRHARDTQRETEIGRQSVVVTLRVPEQQIPLTAQVPPAATREPGPTRLSSPSSHSPRRRMAAHRLAPPLAAPAAAPPPQTDDASPGLAPPAQSLAPEGLPTGGSEAPGIGQGSARVCCGTGASEPVAHAPAPRVPARALTSPHPVYPRQARLMGWEGLVVLRLLVDVHGNVAQVSVTTGSGFTLLDEAAVDAARRWRFEPARDGDRPIAMPHEVRFRFRLDNPTG